MFAHSRIVVPLLLLFILFLFTGSGPSLENSDEQHPTQTEKEQCLANYASSFENFNIDMYAQTLHKDFKQIISSKESIGREEDIEQLRKSVGVISKQKITISKGEWTQINELEGKKCPDCWETIRNVSTTITTKKSNKTYTGNEKVRFVVTQAEVDGHTIYQLLIVESIKP